MNQSLMIRKEIADEINLLPAEVLPELQTFMKYLQFKAGKINGKSVNPPQFGSAKGMIVMADDFDEPLEDFEPYMP